MLALIVGLLLSHAATKESANSAPAPDTSEAGLPYELTSNEPVTRQISTSHAETYQITLPESQHVAIVINKGDTNLQLIISAPNGQTVREFVGYGFGPLRASFISKAAGIYRLEMRSLENDQASREYVLRAQELRPATDRDQREDEAVKIGADAELLRAEWKAEPARAAIKKYEEAAARWQAIGGLSEASAVMLDAGDACFGLSNYADALGFYGKALELARTNRDQVLTMRALNSIGYVHANTDNNKAAEPYFRQALQICERLQSKLPTREDQHCLAQVDNNLGEVFYFRGELTRARSLFARALQLHVESGDRRGQALAHLNLAYTDSDSGFLYSSQEHLTNSFAQWRAVKDVRGEALSHTAQGIVSSFKGEKKSAFDSYRKALQLFRTIGDRQGEAATLNSTGRAYEDLNAPQLALDHYKLALTIFQQSKNRDAEAVTLYYLGRVCRTLADDEQAIVYYQQSLALSRSLGKQRIENYALTDIASIKATNRGQHRPALLEFGKALNFYRRSKDRRGQAHLMKSIGDVYFAESHWTQALASYQSSLALSEKADDRLAESALLYKVALVEEQQGNLDQAVTHIETALRKSESMRIGIDRQDLRSSLFAEVHNQFGLYIDLLMRLNERKPAASLVVTAFETSEAARARSLLETLARADVEVTEGVSKELLNRESALQDALTAEARSQMLVGAGSDGDEEAKKFEAEARSLTNEYQDVRAQIRDQGLRNAAFVQPSRIRLTDLQKEILDNDTVLLEFFLGNERSYLWAVTKKSIDSYELRPGIEIESLAQDVHRMLAAPVDASTAEGTSSRDRQYWQKASALSWMLFGKAAGQLGHKRLLIVSDGALQYVSFDALPFPAAAADASGSDAGDVPTPLLADHEIVSVPSGATLATLRQRETKAAKGSGIVAVLADPVFGPDDPRLKLAPATLAGNETEQIETTQLRTALRDIEVPGDDPELTRLPFTLREAKAIIDLAPERQRLMLTGFDAERARVVDGELRDYRIVHFATHGVINCRHPELSGVVLSMLNERGERENGFLQLHDIYKLDWSTDLVVLSACSTALGQDIRGEGLVGLTQGFLHSGANSVVSTLWTVDDRASAELMQRFYEAMLKQGLAPSAALTKAKRSLWQENRWQSPYYWGAFVLQGDYRQTIRGRDASSNSNRAAVAAMILLGTIGLLTVLWQRSRRRKINST